MFCLQQPCLMGILKFEEAGRYSETAASCLKTQHLQIIDCSKFLKAQYLHCKVQLEILQNCKVKNIT